MQPEQSDTSHDTLTHVRYAKYARSVLSSESLPFIIICVCYVLFQLELMDLFLLLLLL